MTATALQSDLDRPYDSGAMAAMCGVDRQFGVFRHSGVETAREVHPEGFDL